MKARLTFLSGPHQGKRMRRVSTDDLIRSGALAQAITQGIKLTARRTRPDGTSLSFPSGHTASAFDVRKLSL